MVQSFKKQKKTQFTEGITSPIIKIDIVSSMIIYSMLLFGLYLNRMGLEAGKPLVIFEANNLIANGYASLANEHILTVIVLLTLGMFSFWGLSTYYQSLSPIIYVVCSTIIIWNIIFAVVYLTHTSFSSSGETYSVLVLKISFLSLAFLYIAGLKNSLNQFLNRLEKETTNSNKWLMFFYRMSNGYKKMPKLWTICLFPTMIMIQFILVLFGQRPDSMIRVFLETSSFNYSIIPAPKPEIVEGDGHYLCTVSAKGHKKLVKPIRAGIRRGERIPVNRQLLIANAFENILEQHMPIIHKPIRHFYDKYGYPISKHIHSK